jgi:hypothetical protein
MQKGAFFPIYECEISNFQLQHSKSLSKTAMNNAHVNERQIF